jgi:hypothetical protein
MICNFSNSLFILLKFVPKNSTSIAKLWAQSCILLANMRFIQSNLTHIISCFQTPSCFNQYFSQFFRLSNVLYL